MKMRVLHVTTTKEPPCRTKIKISSPWLADMGFVYGAPVRAIPLPDGLTLVLQNEHNEKEGGKLIHVGLYRDKPTMTLNFSKSFSIPGLATGDFLAARYEYGVITARKISRAQKYCAVASHNHGAFLRLNGAWLDDAGFLSDTIVMAAVCRDCITLRLWDESAKPNATYSDIVKFARAHKYQVLRAQVNQKITYINLGAHLLSRAGFGIGDIAGIHYEHGRITLLRSDLQQLGF